MVQGAAGPLQPKQNFVTSTSLANGFTKYQLSDKTKFNLLTPQSRPIKITNFELGVDEICSNGKPLSVRIKYKDDGTVVSLVLKMMNLVNVSVLKRDYMSSAVKLDWLF